MKFIIPVLLLVLTMSIGAAQTTKIYKTSRNTFTEDSTVAKSYVLINKLDDTSYMTSEYNMLDELMEKGMYKDKSLKIPNGKFYYYTVHVNIPGNVANARIVEPYLRKSGYFLNGAKNGTWLLYRYDGKKYVVDHYVNDKLNGVHQMIGADGETITEEGMYVDGKKDKEWNFYRIGFDKPTMTEIYSRDRIVKEMVYYKPFVIKNDFYKSIKKSLKPYIDTLKFKNIGVSFSVTETGKIDSVELNVNMGASLNDAIISAFLSVPKVIPTTFYDKPLSERFSINLLDIGLAENRNATSERQLNQKKNDILLRHTNDIGRGLNQVGIGKPVN